MQAVVLLALFFGLTLGAFYTVVYDPSSQTYSVVPGKVVEAGVAYAEYSDERTTNGWIRFNLVANSNFADNIQAYGSGYLEGYLSAEPIWQSWENALANQFNYTVPSSIYDWFSKNINWTNSQVKANLASPYWVHVGLVVAQVQGLQAGYLAGIGDSSKSLSYLQIVLLNALGDVETLSNFLGIDLKTKARKTAPTYPQAHCSALIKVSDDLSELYAGHTTWSSYFNMLRMFKSYTLPFSASQTAATTTLFSSYPATVSSIDDFYQLSSKLVVTETTNGVYNASLFAAVTWQALPSWLRVYVANRMATSAPNWVSLFSLNNDGTYNNQWIVVDYNLFTPGQVLPDNVLWIAEQIPGHIESGDVTSYLRLGYWPSYNVPFFEYTYNVSGFNSMREQYGDWFTYQLCPRAQIYRRSAGDIESMGDFLKFMRYNNWQHDPLAYGNPLNQVSSRGDLVPTNSTPANPFLDRDAFGGIDSKATSSQLLNLGTLFAQSGPSHDSLPPFDWTAWPQVKHEGMPDVFNFTWVLMPAGSKFNN